MRPILLITSAALLLAAGVASAPVLAAGDPQLDFRELVRLGNASPRLYSILANWHGQPVLEQYFHGKKATTYANEVAGKDNADALDEMKKSGKTTFIELTADEKAAWKAALEPVTADMAKRVGKDVIEEFQKEAKGGTQ